MKEVNSKNLFNFVENFYKSKEKNEKDNKDFKIKKEQFNDKMNKLLDKNGYKENTILVRKETISKTELYRVRRINRTKILYNIKKLKKVLGRDFYDITNKKITVIDQDAFVNLIKKYKINKEELKNVIDIEYMVDENELNDYLEMDSSKEEDIYKCLEVETNFSHFNIKKLYED